MHLASTNQLPFYRLLEYSSLSERSMVNKVEIKEFVQYQYT